MTKLRRWKGGSASSRTDEGGHAGEVGGRSSLALFLVVWILGAFTFALHRIPYDDEWFSLGLALETEWPRFWAVLEGDSHPPWVALLDRGVAMVGAGRVGMHAMRVAASASALVLLGSTLQRTAGLPWWIGVLAAFHPIVLTYAGALRWYPFLFLGQACMAWGLWSTRPGSTRGSAAFAMGAAVAAASSYLGLGVVALNLFWLVARWRRAGVEGAQLARIASWTIVAVGIPLVVSPLGAGHLIERASGRVPGSGSLRRVFGWSGLGPAGEAHPAWPWLLAAALPCLVTLLAWLHARGRASTRGFAWWLLSLGAFWLAATWAGVWHPRYSLAFWLLTTALWVVAWRDRPRLRPVVAVAAAYLAVVGVFTVRGEGFFRMGMNKVSAAACRELVGEPPPDLVVASYGRVAGLLERGCRPEAPVLALPLARLHPKEEKHMAELREQAGEARSIRFVRRTQSTAPLRVTWRRTRQALLEKGCHLVTTREASPVPHHRLKRHIDPDAARHYLRSEHWRCRGR